MPCHDPRDSPSYRNREREELTAQVNTLTDMLCRTLTATDDETVLPADIQKWWMQHQEMDRLRAQGGDLVARICVKCDTAYIGTIHECET